MKSMRIVGGGRWLTAVALALALGALASGCGGGDGKDVTLTIGTRTKINASATNHTAEEAVLGEIYAQALEGAGYGVVREEGLGFEISEATRLLERGRISAYLEHLDEALTGSFGRFLEQVPGNTQKAYQAVQSGFRKKGLTAFPPTPYSSTNAVGALRKTAEARGWKTVSDLEGESEKLTISGPSGCHGGTDCVGGLETRYGLYFAGYIEAPEGPFKALETGFTDLSMVPNTEGRLVAEKNKFAALEDDRHLFPAANAMLVTSRKVVSEAGPEFEQTIVAAQKGLSLPVIQKLDAKVEVGHQTPKAVAAGYLRQVGLSG